MLKNLEEQQEKLKQEEKDKIIEREELTEKLSNKKKELYAKDNEVAGLNVTKQMEHDMFLNDYPNHTEYKEKFSPGGVANDIENQDGDADEDPDTSKQRLLP